MNRPIARAGMACLAGAICLLSALLAAGCKPPPPGPVDDLPPLEGLEADPARVPGPPAPPAPTVGVGQILVAYIGAYDPKVKLRFQRPEALERARHLAALARSKGTDFGQLASRFSDDPRSGRNNGDMGVISPGMLHPDLEAVAFALELGQVSEPIETPRGFHILRRIEPSEAQAAEVVVSYTGAKKFTPRQPRTRDEAETLAREVVARLRGGASFAEEARTWSDQPNWDRGGFFPIFQKGSRHPTFENIVWNTRPGEVSDPVETPTGFHVVGRWPALRIRGRAMRFPFLEGDALERARANPQAQRDAVRSRAEALALAGEIRRRVVEGGEDFAALARDHLDASLAERDGLLDWFGRGEVPLAVEQQAFALAPGAVSGVIEVDGAFFLFKRVH